MSVCLIQFSIITVGFLQIHGRIAVCVCVCRVLIYFQYSTSIVDYYANQFCLISRSENKLEQCENAIGKTMEEERELSTKEKTSIPYWMYWDVLEWITS